MAGGVWGDKGLSGDELRLRTAGDQTRRDARKNLAALVCDAHGVNPARDRVTDLRVQYAARDFRLLADALGLGEP